MIPYSRQSVDANDIKAVVGVLSSDFITQGPTVSKFEKSLALYCGVEYAVAVSNGTAALHLAYLAAGLKKGDEAITTPNTFAATSNMLLVVGARPVFADIRLDTRNLDETKIEKLITPKTKVIVPVHFAGLPCDMKTISSIAKKRRLLVIEDACHALGARYRDSKIGDCKYSDMAVFSFHPVKTITTGEGGAVLTNKKSYYDKLLRLRSHGIHKDKIGKNVMTALGYNYRMTDIQAALGLSQLSKVDSFVRRRNQVARYYEEELKNSKDVLLPVSFPGYYSAGHIYVIRVSNRKNRDELASFLKKNGIGANFHYPAVYSHPYYRRNGYKNIRLAQTEKYHNSCITLPCYPGLSKSIVREIAGLINKFFIKNENTRVDSV
ncbi:MAG: UDP-4-amino-4,6-dideoxy-N-acetyl-beta-L-altrosamine transaminase [Candidatus Niyogibacteria bacterium]|nr:MAG: UDP-4-amino-4,6-dideoxy-N-acetyl-beta-L-altrosamine transaminase [Candidatus Niyogibacteria bacterium]